MKVDPVYKRALEIEQAVDTIVKHTQTWQRDTTDELVAMVYDLTQIETTQCAHCGRFIPEITAHLHQGEWIGDVCCWTETLRGSE